jgi:hypothetical protein
MNNIYIKFSSRTPQVKREKESVFKKIFKMALIFFIPVGNPNFEDKIEEVVQWLVEFEDNKQYPNREIGLDIFQQPIMIMPWRKNYGYWIDNDLLLDDFKSRFKAIEITKEEFENHWQQFLRENNDL